MDARIETEIESVVPVPCPGPAALEGVFRFHAEHARSRFLAFLGSLRPEDFTKPLDGFRNRSIRDMLAHIIETERFWISVLSTESRPSFDAGAIRDLPAAARAWEDAAERTFSLLRGADLDWFVNAGRFETRPGEPPESLVPSLVALHVLTHEFHHKGQICTAARQLGYEPPDLDLV